MNESPEEVTRSDLEKRAYSQLPRAKQPAEPLEGRVIRGLRQHGWLRSEASEWGARQLRLATALGLAFALGSLASWAVLRKGDEAPLVAETGDYFLLLYGNPERPEENGAQRAKEYAQWATNARHDGRTIDGERLSSQRAMLPETGDPTAATQLQGFFRFTASDFRSAMDFAKSCPHLSHGGRLELRETARP